jgi:predicted GTPase
MSLITDTLEIFRGRLRFHLLVDGKSAVDVVITPGEAIIEIKNPVLALEMGLQQIGKKKGISSYVLKAVKAAGYKVKVKYKVLEMEL